MFYLIWEMGILLLLAVGFGVFVGYQLWSGDARSAEADAAIAENARLRQENENLARRLGEAEAQSRIVATAAAELAPVREVVAEAVAPAAETRAVAEAQPAGESKSAPTPKSTAKSAKPKPAAPARAAKPKPASKAAPKAKAEAETKPDSVSDDLGAIKGLGPKAAAALKAGGVTSVAQIAGWSDADIERWDQAINGRGRIVRDDWVGQARKLAGED